MNHIVLSIIIGLFTFTLAHLILKSPIDYIKNECVKLFYRIKNSSVKNRSLRSFFHIIKGQNKTDMVAYQFGLRPKLPIIDILYLELLKHFNLKDEIKQIVIFPTIDKSATSQQTEDLKEFEENLEKVFCHNPDCFRVIDPFRESSLTSKELVEEKFIDTLSYLGHEKFYAQVKNVSKYQIKGIEDFNKFHKKDKSIITLITHVFKAWEVREYILNQINASSKNKMNIGFIFWEVEFDKWGIYDRTSKDDKIQEVALFIGKSIYGRKNFFSKYKPIPVFTNEALSIFDEKHQILEKTTMHNKAQVKVLNIILTSILTDNYNEELTEKKLLSESKELIDSLNTSDNHFISSYNSVSEKLTKSHKILFTLILKLRSKYGC